MVRQLTAAATDPLALCRAVLHVAAAKGAGHD